MKNKITVEEFLEAGHKFVAGDKISSMLECTDYLLVGNLENGVSVERANSGISAPSKRYVISAKALDKPKCTKVTYEKVSFDKLSDAFLEHERAPLNVFFDSFPIAISDCTLVNQFNKKQFYRKVESEITPMQAAKDACKEFACKSKTISVTEPFILDFITEDGESFSGEFIEMCRTIVDAYDGK